MTAKYTPKEIVAQNVRFSIPLYQRLFEWNSDNIETLMDDLYRAFSHTPANDYYIGLLTDTKTGELIDGQQRFTVMTIMACVLKNYTDNEGWNEFLSPESPRLQIKSRPQDERFLKRMMKGDRVSDGEYENPKMQQAFETIEKFVNGIEAAKQVDFSNFVFNHTALFVSDLPEHYSSGALNKYFERMNSTGKNLEHHEILKVKLLRTLKGNLSPYMCLWNRLAEMNRPLITCRRNDDDYCSSLESMLNVLKSSNVREIAESDWIKLKNKDVSHSPISIDSIEASDNEPTTDGVYDNYGSRSVIGFPMLLLLTLYWKLKEDNKLGKELPLSDFFITSNLLEVFEHYLPFEGTDANAQDIEDFFLRLIKARIILDYCFVRTMDFGYELEMANDSEDGRVLMMFESMLWVSSNRYTYYRWFESLMRNVMDSIEGETHCFPTETELFTALRKDNYGSNHLPEESGLRYGYDIRYWFWRLDLYIWRHRVEIFKNYPKALNVAERYRFSRNRSIEHVAPQHPLQQSTLQWGDGDESIRDSFGNLVMISNGLNSALKNQPYEIKRAHVDAYVNDSLTGSIESLSLLLLTCLYEIWDKDTISKFKEITYGYLCEDAIDS